MRRRPVVAAAALIAALALAALPVPAGSHQPTSTRDPQAAAFTSVIVPADAPALRARGAAEPARDVLAAAAVPVAFVKLGKAPTEPAARPVVELPAPDRGSAWKAPRRTITGYASFYDNGTTAMRLPRGTVVRICGRGGCIERTITDYGPADRNGRIVDLDRPDFFAICGCASWSGTTTVTVSIY